MHLRSKAESAVNPDYQVSVSDASLYSLPTKAKTDVWKLSHENYKA